MGAAQTADVPISSAGRTRIVWPQRRTYRRRGALLELITRGNKLDWVLSTPDVNPYLVQKFSDFQNKALLDRVLKVKGPQEASERSDGNNSEVAPPKK